MLEAISVHFYTPRLDFGRAGRFVDLDEAAT